MASTPSRVRATNATRTPASRSCWTRARPRPDVPPVTSARRPWSACVFDMASCYKLKLTLSQAIIVMSDLLTISDVARRSGVAASALRYYEQRGLIQSERAGSGHRRFPRAVLRRIAFIVFAQKIGLSLDEVAIELSKLPHNHVPERGDWAKLSAGWSQR